MRLMKMSILAAMAVMAVMAVSVSAASAAWKPAGDEVAISGHLKFGLGWTIDCDASSTETLQSPASSKLVSSSPVGACDIMWGSFPYPIGSAAVNSSEWIFTDNGNGTVTAGFSWAGITTNWACSITISNAAITGAWTNGAVEEEEEEEFVVTPGKLTLNGASGVYFNSSGSPCTAGNQPVTGSLEFRDVTNPAQPVTLG